MNSNNKIKLNMDSLKTSKEWIRHKVKNGSNIFRILPPFGDNSNGYPYRKWQIIWGLTDPASGRVRPYASPLMTEKRCPVTEYVDLLKERLSKMEGDLKTRGLDDKAVRKHPKYERLSKFTRDITPKTTYIYNAADKAGVVGLLELKATAHKDMKACMNDYIRDYNQDPTSLNSADDDSGVWFNVKRSGEGFDTEYKVEKVQNKVKNGNTVSFQDDRSPLADVIVENFDNLAYDLSSVYKSTTYDDVNEVLQANMDTFHQVCPEANLSLPVDLDSDDADEEAVPVKAASHAKAQATSTVTKPTGKAPVALKLQDDDDAVEETPKAVVKKSAPVMDDDDFMAQADAILKG
jgi:hypothetical protein